MKTTTAEMNPEAVARLRELIADIGVAMLITVTPEGVLRSRPLRTQLTHDEGEVLFFISEESGIATDIAEEPGVNVSYSKPENERYVSVSGQAHLVTDIDRMEQLWDPALTRYFPDGLDDPHLALLCVRIESAEYWDESASKMMSVRKGPGKRTERAKTTAVGQAKPTGDGDDQADGAKDADGTDEDDGHTKVDIRATRASG